MVPGLASSQNQPGLASDIRLKLGLLLVVDVLATSWMLANKSWLDHDSWNSRVITIGGNLDWMLTVSVLGTALLALMAVMTRGFKAPSPIEYFFILSAVIMSVIMISGLLVAAVVVAVSLVVGVAVAAGLVTALFG